VLERKYSRYTTTNRKFGTSDRDAFLPFLLAVRLQEGIALGTHLQRGLHLSAILLTYSVIMHFYKFDIDATYSLSAQLYMVCNYHELVKFCLCMESIAPHNIFQQSQTHTLAESCIDVSGIL